MQSWSWIIFSLFLLGLEVLFPSGFILLFFGMGALTVGVLSLVELISGLHYELLLFTALSLVYLFLFRRYYSTGQENRDKSADRASLSGEVAIASEAIAPGGFGRVEARGTQWQGENIGAEPVERGDRCVVKAVEGVKLRFERQQ